MNTNHEGWINAFPELRTRPALIGELEQDRRLRSKLFHAFNVMHNVTNCPEQDVATEILALVADHYWANIKTRFIPDLEIKNHIAVNELTGLYRNFVLNMRARIKPTRQRKYKNPHYIIREGRYANRQSG